MACFRSADVRQLLHNKFVVVLGDSIQRSVYKDLVILLQDDKFLSEAQLKCKGEKSFAKDTLVEGGSLNVMHNRTNYREVRQYRTGHHLVRFYFLTRVYSAYLESILSDFKSGPQPDVLIANSCIWDLMRYSDTLEAYKTNLETLFQRLKEVLSPQCLIIWNMTMPVGYRSNELPQDMAHNLRWDIVEGNFFSATLANIHKLDVLDMHYLFRCDLRLRCRDAIHWNQVAHRKYTQILLTHIAQAWNVEPPKGNKAEGLSVPAAPPQSVALRKDPKLHPTFRKPARCRQGKIPLLPIPNGVDMGSQHTGQRMIHAEYVVLGQLLRLLDDGAISAGAAAYMTGYTSFDNSDINAMPGVLCPVDYTNDILSSSDATSPFVTDSPLLTANITPGYYIRPPGPAIASHGFAGRFLLPNIPPPMNFPPLPHHSPYLQEDWNMKMPRRVLKPRMGWTHPYPRPPVYPPRIY